MSKTLKQMTEEFIAYAIPFQTKHFEEAWKVPPAQGVCDYYRMIYEWPHLRVTDFDTSLTREEVLEYVMEHPVTKTAITNFALAVASRLVERQGINDCSYTHLPDALLIRDSFEKAVTALLHFKLDYFTEATFNEEIDVSELETCTPDFAQITQDLTTITAVIRRFAQALVNRCFEAIQKN